MRSRATTPTRRRTAASRSSATSPLSVTATRRLPGAERQRPDAPCPGDEDQQHQARPAQTARLDEMAVAGAHSVSVGRRWSGDAPAPAPLQRVVDTDDDGPGRHEGGDQQPEQHARRGPRRPARPVRHAVVAGEPRPAVPPRRARGGGTAGARRRSVRRPAAPRDGLKTLGLLLQPVAPELPGTVLGHLDPPTAELDEPAGERAGVGAIAPDQLQSRPAFPPGAGHQSLRAEPVMNVGGVHMGEQDQPDSIDKDVALAAGGALGRIPPVPLRGPEDRLCREPDRRRRWSARLIAARSRAVDDGGAGLGGSALGLACQGAQTIVQTAQRAVASPAPELSVHGRPWREVPRQPPPCAARPNEVEDRLCSRSTRPLERPATTRGRREQRLQRGPFGVSQIGGIRAMARVRHGVLRGPVTTEKNADPAGYFTQRLCTRSVSKVVRTGKLTPDVAGAGKRT